MIKEEWKYRIDGGMIWPIKGKELLTKEVKKYANQIKGSNKKLQQKAWNDVHIKMINHGMPNSITEKKLRRYYFQTTRTERKSVNLSMSDSLLSESPEYEYQMKNKKISIMDTPAVSLKFIYFFFSIRNLILLINLYFVEILSHISFVNAGANKCRKNAYRS